MVFGGVEQAQEFSAECLERPEVVVAVEEEAEGVEVVVGRERRSTSIWHRGRCTR